MNIIKSLFAVLLITGVAYILCNPTINFPDIDSDKVKTTPVKKKAAVVAKPPTEKIAPSKIKQASYSNACDKDKEAFINDLRQFTQELEDQKIKYNAAQLSDCSGIFFRITRRLQDNCPKRSYPSTGKLRSTKDIASWYHEKGKLKLIEDISKATHLIQPGTVIFYGQRDKRYSNFDIDDLTSSSGIEHVGIVTAIEMQDKQLQSYTLFHGRSNGIIASHTKHHTAQKKIRNGKTYPAFGNGRQEIVAIANL